MSDVVTAHTAEVDGRTLTAAHDLLATAFGDLTDEDWEHALGGVHALLWEGEDLIGHASVVQRRLLHGGHALRAGYVEGVAVRPDRQRRGHGNALMEAVERVIRGAYEMGGLGATDEAVRLYTSRGWQRWRGPTSAVTPQGVVRTEDYDGSVYVLPVTAQLDLDGRGHLRRARRRRLVAAGRRVTRSLSRSAGLHMTRLHSEHRRPRRAVNPRRSAAVAIAIARQSWPMATFPRLFEPLPLRGRVVKNRIVSTAHIPRYGEGGLLNEQHIRYLERKAAGGAGLLINFGSAGIHEEAAAPVETINLWNRANEHPLRDLATRVHAHGCLIMSQATHMGRRAHSLRGGVVTAPSAVPELVHAETPKALTTGEIRAIVASFASAATRLEAYGWDGIEITSFGGHLIEQFWSPVANRRRDAYGGDLEGRMRFSIDVVESVAGAVSEDFLVGFRISGDPGTDVLGLGPDDMLEIASRLDAIGRIDLFDVSGGTGVDRAVQVGTVPVDSFPPGCYNHLGRAMRERLSVPVLLAGRIIGPAEAEAALAEGAADLVGMARALIADPDLPRRAEAGEADRIRPCIAINDECIGRASLGYAMRCAINPEIGRELEPIVYAPTDTPRRVVVAGGGPAGMEAARVAAERGHSVVLLERLDHLGGQVVTAARAPGRPHLGRHVAWLERELARLGVDVRTGVSADAAAVRELAPDAVVVATGAEAAVPDEGSGVPSATEVDVLEGRADVPYGATVLVYDRGGTMRGASAALALAANGELRVTLATPLLDACEKVDPWQRADLLRRLFLAGVDCVQNEILAGGSGGAALRHSWSGAERPLAEYDLVVFAGYSAPRAAFADELAHGGAIQLVGDCLAPRRLHDAVVEGVRAGAAV